MTPNLWQRLHQAGLVTEDAVPHTPIDTLPFFTRLLAGCGAWIAACFTLGLVFSFTTNWVFTSALYAGVGFWLYYFVHDKTSVFLQHAILACFLISQGLLSFGIFLLDDQTRFVLLPSILILVNAWLFITINHAMLKQACSYLLLANIVWLCWGPWVSWLIPVFLLISFILLFNLERLAIWYLWVRPLALATSSFYALSYLSVFVELAQENAHFLLFLPQENIWENFFWANLLVSVLSLILGLFYLHQRLALPLLPHRWHLNHGIGVCLVTFLSVLNHWVFGLSGMAVLLLLTVGLDYRTLMTRLLLSLCCILFLYYYSLHINLLYKSVLLMGSGMVLLTIAAFIHYGLRQERQREETTL